jgi:hypothetical protein
MLVISDANILIDMEVGRLIAPMFSLDIVFTVPDVLYHDELAGQHAHLLDAGLQLRSLSALTMARALSLSQTYARPGRNDLLALALAEAERCPLLTGDAALRQAAEAERVEIRGTLWLVSAMLSHGGISVATARSAFDGMRANGRRLPWDVADRLLASHAPAA